MGIAHYMIVDPRTGTVEVRCEPCGNGCGQKKPDIHGGVVPFGP